MNITGRCPYSDPALLMSQRLFFGFLITLLRKCQHLDLGDSSFRFLWKMREVEIKLGFVCDAGWGGLPRNVLSHLCEDPVAQNLPKLRISEPKGERPCGRTIVLCPEPSSGVCRIARMQWVQTSGRGNQYFVSLPCPLACESVCRQTPQQRMLYSWFQLTHFPGLSLSVSRLNRSRLILIQTISGFSE